MLGLWMFMDVVVFYLILMVIRVHASRSGTEMLWSCCGQSDGMWWGLSAALEMGTYAVIPMRCMFHEQLMMYYKGHIQQASVAA